MVQEDLWKLVEAPRKSAGPEKSFRLLSCGHCMMLLVTTVWTDAQCTAQETSSETVNASPRR